MKYIQTDTVKSNAVKGVNKKIISTPFNPYIFSSLKFTGITPVRFKII